jgi:hypothetical protein
MADLEHSTILIASPLEVEHAARIAAAAPRTCLIYEPELLPVSRYPSDRDGIRRNLGPDRGSDRTVAGVLGLRLQFNDEGRQCLIAPALCSWPVRPPG